MLAEHFIRHGGGPVLQRRFFEIFQIVQARRDPVAAGHHLARNLGVTAFIRLDQVTIFQIAEPDDHQSEQQQP